MTERNRTNIYSQRRGHFGGSYSLQSLITVVEDSVIRDYTVEQVVNKADPSDYKQELARFGFVLQLNDKEETKVESPSKTASKMST